MIETAIEGMVEAMVPGRFLVETISWLKYIPGWVPGAGFQRKAKAWNESYQKASTATYEGFKKGLVSETYLLSDFFPYPYLKSG